MNKGPLLSIDWLGLTKMGNNPKNRAYPVNADTH